MNSEIYQFESSNIYEYRFKSLGKRIITKVVQFAPLNIQGYYNLGFGDLLDNGLIDDNIESNNNDLKKVISTIGAILFNFLQQNPGIKVFFHGSNQQRTKVYGLIIKRNYKELKNNYVITSLLKIDGILVEMPFEFDDSKNYLGFFIKLNS